MFGARAGPGLPFADDGRSAEGCGVRSDTAWPQSEVRGMTRIAPLLIFALLTSCSRETEQTTQSPQPPQNTESPAAPAQGKPDASSDAHYEPVEPPAPGTPGGLPDD